MSFDDDTWIDHRTGEKHVPDSPGIYTFNESDLSKP